MRDSSGNADAGDGGTGHVGGVEDDQFGFVAGIGVDEADEPAAVLVGGPRRIGDEDEVAGLAAGSESMTVTASGGQVVLVDGVPPVVSTTASSADEKLAFDTGQVLSPS